MGCCYSLLSTEDRKLIAILKYYDVFSSSQFLKMKAALAYKKAYILDENGKRKLTLPRLVNLNNILTDRFYNKVNNFTYFKPIWFMENRTLEERTVNYHDSLLNTIKLYNIDCIGEENFFEDLMDIFLYCETLTCKILFFK